MRACLKDEMYISSFLNKECTTGICVQNCFGRIVKCLTGVCDMVDDRCSGGSKPGYTDQSL